MSIVVTIQGVIPPPRGDNHAWTEARIEEAPSDQGPWTQIEAITLSPVDADPLNPIPRDLTTEEATDFNLWYRVIFADADGDTTIPTTPLLNSNDEDPAFLPTIKQVGSLLHARTKNRFGVEVGTFTADTRPTHTEVEHIIWTALQNVNAALNGDVPDEWIQEASEIVALKAAMLVELSFFAEQVSTGRSPYDRYKELYDQKIAALLGAIRLTNDSNADITANSPQYSFNDHGIAGSFRW